MSVRSDRANGRRAVWGSQARAAAGSLFDRLILDEEDADARIGAHSIDAVIRSIKRNLERILNTHAGGAAANPKLGVSDFNDGAVRSNDATAHIMASIRHCIGAYEPRIDDVQVSYLADADQPLTLRFSIQAKVKASSSNELVRIDMAMRDGRFRELH
jgi:type VI secretion system lysozyme-like protein